MPQANEHCEFCEATENLTLVNGRPYCRDHLDDGLQQAALPLNRLIELFSGQEELDLAVENHPSNQ